MGERTWSTLAVVTGSAASSGRRQAWDQGSLQAAWSDRIDAAGSVTSAS
jgi:hypothetical protein